MEIMNSPKGEETQQPITTRLMKLA